MRAPNPNKLLVEGEDDKRVIPQLIEANGVPWGERRDEWIVEIVPRGGIDEILKPGSIGAELKQRSLVRLGIVLDANGELESRWSRLRDQCRSAFPGIPDDLPEDGVVVSNHEDKTLGIWFLPDNRAPGMLETFLSRLVSPEDGELWRHATETTAAARECGARFRDANQDKAEIHAFLAWQDLPGRQLHDALVQHHLDPRSPYAAGFVAWFCRLYGLAAPASPAHR